MVTLNAQNQPVYKLDGTTYVAADLEMRPRVDGGYDIVIAATGVVVGGSTVPLDNISVAEEAPVGTMMLVYDEDNEKAVRLMGNRMGGAFVNNRMPSKAVFNTKAEWHLDGITASQSLGAPTVGTFLQDGLHEFHLTGLIIAGTNASVQNNTKFRIRDGGPAGTVRLAWQHGTGAVGAAEHFEFAHKFDEHPVFSGLPYIEVVSGTLNMAINLQGYVHHTADHA